MGEKEDKENLLRYAQEAWDRAMKKIAREELDEHKSEALKWLADGHYLFTYNRSPLVHCHHRDDQRPFFYLKREALQELEAEGKVRARTFRPDDARHMEYTVYALPEAGGNLEGIATSSSADKPHSP